MSLSSLLQHEVKVSRPTATAGTFDAHGNPEPGTWTDDYFDTRAFMQPNTETENREGQTSVTSDWTAFFSPATAISTAARVLWDGRFFHVVGVQEQQRPGRRHHVEVQLLEVRGGPPG